MGVAIYGNYGTPILAFPTSCGDEHEQEGQGMIRTLSPYLDAGAHPNLLHQRRAERFVRKQGSAPFPSQLDAGAIRRLCGERSLPVHRLRSARRRASGSPRYGASLGAYHAANTLFKHPDHVKRCYALSGVYDMRDSMDGMYDDNFYFNNPVDYMANQNDPWFLHQYASCDIRLVTGCWPVGEQRPDLPNVRGT